MENKKNVTFTAELTVDTNETEFVKCIGMSEEEVDILAEKYKALVRETLDEKKRNKADFLFSLTAKELFLVASVGAETCINNAAKDVLNQAINEDDHEIIAKFKKGMQDDMDKNPMEKLMSMLSEMQEGMMKDEQEDDDLSDTLDISMN